MSNTSPSRLDIRDAILVLKAASRDDNASKIVREIVKERYDPQVIELIRALYKDSEVFCDGMREFVKEPDPIVADPDAPIEFHRFVERMNAKRNAPIAEEPDPIADEMEANYGKGFARRND